MKNKKYNLLKAVIFTIVTLIGLGILYKIFRWKDTSGDYISSVDSFYSLNEDTVDVLFVGPSYTYYGINPAILWKEYSIPSFDLAISGQDKESAYHYLIEALKTQSPKVVCIDYSEIMYSDYFMKSTLYRNAISMHLSKNNVDLIRKIVKEDNPLDYILRWPIVHKRYKELKAFDFIDNNASVIPLGYVYSDAISTWEMDESILNVSETSTLDDSIVEWVDNLVELSNEYNFELLMVKTCFEETKEQKILFNSVEKYFMHQNVDFINFDAVYNQAGLDTHTDYIDHGHTNWSGAYKITNYLAKYIQENYELSSISRNVTDYDRWEKCSEYYDRIRLKEYLRESTNAVDVVNAVKDKNDCIIVIGLEGDYINRNEHAHDAFKAMGLSDEEWLSFGTWLFIDGKKDSFVDPIIDSEAHARINNQNIMKVTKEDKGIWWNQTIVTINGNVINAWENAQTGLYILVYDCITDDVIYNNYLK